MESLLSLVEEAREREGFRRVRTLRVAVGAFAAVDPGALRFCFDVAAKGGVAEGARFVIEEIPGEGWCLGCGQTVSLEKKGNPCPACGSFWIQATKGDDLRVVDLLVE